MLLSRDNFPASFLTAHRALVERKGKQCSCDTSGLHVISSMNDTINEITGQSEKNDTATNDIIATGGIDVQVKLLIYWNPVLRSST